MDRKRLTELLESFTCTDGCDSLSAKELGELRDGLTAWQADLENEMNEADIERIAKIATQRDAVDAKIAALKEEFAAKVAEATGSKTEIVVGVEDEDDDLSAFQLDRPAETEDEGETLPGKVLIASSTDKDGVTTFEGIVNSSLELAKAVQRSAERYATGLGVDGRITVVRGSYSDKNREVITNNDPTEATAKMLNAVKAFEEYQNSFNNGLTADGGFCAPITPDLTFCDLSETSLDLFQASLPAVQSIRGRVQYMQTPTNDQFYDQWGGIEQDTFVGVGTRFDEDDSIAVDPANQSTWKGLIEVDCPTQQDPAEIAAHYTNVLYKHFTWKAYPEYVNLFIQKALQAHALKESLSLYNEVAATAETVAGVEGVPGTITGFFTALDTQFAAYRDAFWLSRTQVIDTVLPHWVLSVLRAALARKAENEVEALRTADAVINGLFANINVRVNFVSGLNRLAVSTDGASNTVSPIVPAAGVNKLPNAVPVLAWVPGSVVLLNDPDWNIGLERIRDTATQRMNAYSLFTETFSGLAYPCPYPVQAFDVAFCPTGERPPVADYDCADVSGSLVAS